MDIREYMARRCVCGQTRQAHVHFDEFVTVKGESTLRRPTGKFRVLPVNDFNHCPGFLDEIELELRGCPATNPHLGPLTAENLRRWSADELAAGQRDPTEEPEI